MLSDFYHSHAHCFGKSCDVTFYHDRGIAWAPACGKSMSELILNGKSTCVNLAPFDPARFTPASERGRGRKKQGDSIGEQW